MRAVFSIFLVTILSGCLAQPPAQTQRPVQMLQPTRSPKEAAESFKSVIARVEPVAEQICRNRSPELDCDFQIAVDGREGQPPNAFQTADRKGRPFIVFTIPLIATARNDDELAFVLGHEAAHHIVGHIAKTQESAMTGAVLSGLIATLAGADAAGIEAAQDAGGLVGARRYSKGFELEADALGTIIAFRAGYDPARGSEYFERIPDPADTFLSTHPPNSDRRATVLRTLNRLQ